MTASLQPGDVVAGRYAVEELLGEGGMAVVYRARHRITTKLCALKLVHPELAEKPGVVHKFLAEAEVAGRIGAHPNIVDVYDAGIDDERAQPFIAMELLEGATLEDHLAEHGPMSVEEALGVLEQLADALDAAHAANVIHRDLKTANVFVLEQKGRRIVKVLDFGIAKVMEGLDEATATQIGTPTYCAPEQLGAGLRKLAQDRGFTIATGVSPGTDVHALGLVAWSMLTGVDPLTYWQTSSFGDLVVRVALSARVPPSEIDPELASSLPPGFDSWFLVCVAHDAAKRWLTASDAVEGFRGLFANPPGREDTLRLPEHEPPPDTLPTGGQYDDLDDLVTVERSKLEEPEETTHVKMRRTTTPPRVDPPTVPLSAMTAHAPSSAAMPSAWQGLSPTERTVVVAGAVLGALALALGAAVIASVAESPSTAWQGAIKHAAAQVDASVRDSSESTHAPTSSSASAR